MVLYKYEVFVNYTNAFHILRNLLHINTVYSSYILIMNLLKSSILWKWYEFFIISMKFSSIIWIIHILKYVYVYLKRSFLDLSSFFNTVFKLITKRSIANSGEKGLSMRSISIYIDVVDIITTHNGATYNSKSCSYSNSIALLKPYEVVVAYSTILWYNRNKCYIKIQVMEPPTTQDYDDDDDDDDVDDDSIQPLKWDLQETLFPVTFKWSYINCLKIAEQRHKKSCFDSGGNILRRVWLDLGPGSSFAC